MNSCCYQSMTFQEHTNQHQVHTPMAYMIGIENMGQLLPIAMGLPLTTRHKVHLMVGAI